MNPMSWVSPLLIISRSDIRKPRGRRGSKLTKITQIITVILGLKSQLAVFSPPLSLRVHVSIYSKHAPYWAGKCLTNVTRTVFPRKHSDTGSSWALDLAQTLISLLSPRTLLRAEGTAVFWWCRLLSGVGAFSLLFPLPKYSSSSPPSSTFLFLLLPGDSTSFTSFRKPFLITLLQTISKSWVFHVLPKAHKRRKA